MVISSRCHCENIINHICSIFFLPCLVLATPLPDTGQTKCYDDLGNEINPYPQPSEPFYGQDAQYDVNPQSYTKLDATGSDLPDDTPWPWAMVRYNVTGLIWEVKTEDGSIHDRDNIYTWERAMTFSSTLNTEHFGGYNDWRLPTVKELHSIVDSSIPYPGPTINTYYFSPTQPPGYWSSTTYASRPYEAWFVFFYDGSLDEGYKYNHVRAVRGGHCESFGDLDGDCRTDCIDNCVSTPNCLDSGTCTKGTIAQPCNSNEQCGAGGFCSMQQEDTDGDYLGDACDYCPHDPENDIDSDSICGDIDICPNNYDSTQQDTSPPQGNGIGDACECESDFGCDGDVDGSDASTFKLYFGRNLLYYPCDHINPCRGDFSCDGDVDGSDAALFKLDFGRSAFSNPCPACVVEDWCQYQ